MAAYQGIIRRVVASNPNAKYKLKYTYNVSQVARNGTVTTKYNYSKLISTLSTKKYSYST